MVQNGSKWFEFVCSYCSFGVIQNCSLHTGTVDKWSKEAVNKMNCGCHMDPSHFFLSPQFIANWPDFRLNLNQLFSTLLSFSSGYWATLSMCTDLHCIALRYCVFCHVLPCSAMFCQCFWARPDRYDRKGVTEQLRYGGVLQADLADLTCRNDRPERCRWQRCIKWIGTCSQRTDENRLKRKNNRTTKLSRTKQTKVGWCWRMLDLFG